MGPAVSWSAVMGMNAVAADASTVGLMPTSMFWFAG